MKKSLKIILFAIAAILAAGIIGVLIYNNSTPVKYNRQLDLGNKYLTEQDYEQAKVAYEQAIEIDPMGVEAYAGLADVYIAQGEYENALNTLKTGIELTADEGLAIKIVDVYLSLAEVYASQGDEQRAIEVLTEGYELTGDERLEEKLQELTAQIEKAKSEEIKQAVRAQLEEIREVATVSMHHKWGNGVYGNHLTDTQINELCMPYVELLESYREIYSEDSNMGETPDAPNWKYLFELYIGMGEWEKCLEVRKQLYEITSNEYYLPEETTIYTTKGSNSYNEYGQALSDEAVFDDNEKHSTYTYNENGQMVHEETISSIVDERCGTGKCLLTRSFSYDTEGRVCEAVLETVREYADGCSEKSIYISVYEYDNAGFVVHNEEQKYINGGLCFIAKSFSDATIDSYGVPVYGTAGGYEREEYANSVDLLRHY